MKARFLAACMACLIMVPAAAFADGGFVSATAFAKVEIPDQRALIRFADGIETLVIDTAFRGAGTNFAWIVPVPSAPKIEAATTGLFPTLDTIFQPNVVHDPIGAYKLALLLGVLAIYALWKLRRGDSFEILVILGSLALLAGLLLPSLAPAGFSGSFGSVGVIERKTVGVYETTTLSSRDGGALLNWLNKNGYVTPTNFIPAIRAYAQEGWFFVASKIRLDAPPQEAARPHPLAFTFKTERPVYPLRLTGIGNKSCRIDLYVFGPNRATLPNFKIERCAGPFYPAAADEHEHWRLDALRIRHPLLRRLVDQSPVATKLTGRLTTQQMQNDAYLGWSPFQPKRRTFYSERGAAVVAANVAVPMLMVGLLICYETNRRATAQMKAVWQTGIILSWAALASWPAIYFALPKTQVVVSRLPAARTSHARNYMIPSELESQRARATKKTGGTFKPDTAWVRQQLAEDSEFRRALPVYFQTNLLSGQLWHEEDSPGNYTLRDTPEGIDYVWYDIDGAETVVRLFRERK